MNRFNISTLNRYAINCASYALGIKDWLNFPEELVYNGEKDINKKLRDYTDVILKLPFVRQISSVDDLNKDEYAIAFKCSFNDFHFIKRCSNGIWKEKCGSCPTLFNRSRDYVFSKVWLGRDFITKYDSDTVLFAVKKNKYRNEEIYVVCQEDEYYQNYFVVENIFNNIEEAIFYKLKMIKRHSYQRFLVENRLY